MPIESPEQFELSSLEACLSSLDSANESKSGFYCSVFSIIGLSLFLAVYFFDGKESLPPFTLYFLSAIGGVLLGGAAIVNRTQSQSNLLIKYIDRNALKKRIAELKI